MPSLQNQAVEDRRVSGTGGDAPALSKADDTGDAPARSKAEGGASRESAAKTSTYIVQQGDCLWQIAARQLGNSPSDAAIAKEVTRLWKLNAKRIGTGDPDLIHPGQSLTL